MNNLIRQIALTLRLKWQFKTWSPEQIEHHQQKQIKKLLSILKQKSPYYQKLLSGVLPADLDALPFMNKSTLMENFNKINTADLDRDELVDFKVSQEQQGLSDLFRDRYSVGLSSGTSGNQVLTLLSRAERRDYGPLVMARANLPKIRGQYRVLFALRVNNPVFMEISNRKLFLTHVNYTHNPDQLISIINDKKLNILAGPPSLLRMLLPYADQILNQIYGIVCYAEVLSPETKSLLNKTFDAPVSQIYQGAEGFLAGTCHAGGLHLNEDVLKIDLQDTADSENNLKRVVITDLYRTTLPFIRYELNDLIELDTEPCPCGSHFRKIKKIHGRADDVFELIGDNQSIKHLFPDYVRRSIIQASAEIHQYQALQKAYDEIEIRLFLSNNANQADIHKKIERNLKRWVNQLPAKMPGITFSTKAPELHPRSKKMIRIRKDF